jgi:putative ABC transport system substrate-binding protein
MNIRVRRREFITLLGSAAVAWPLTARAQQGERMRRVGILQMSREDNPNSQAGVAAFREGLARLGWTVGRNLQIDYRWAAGDLEKLPIGAGELLRLTPDVVLTPASPPLAAMQQATRTIPIVFIIVNDPIAQGFVASLAHPGGNVTGFSNLEPSFGTKWPEMLKEITPHLTHVAIMFHPDNSGTVLLARSAAAAAPGFGLETTLAPVRGPSEIEAAMASLARVPGGGLILPPDGTLTPYRELIAELAARFGLSAISSDREFAVAGGLVSYGVDVSGQYRQAAAYVDRILRGENPADLPVQQPTKFDLVINLKTAKALGLTISNAMQLRADEVIE